MARILPAEVRKLMDEGKSPVIVDARNNAAFVRDPRRIPGALRIELDRIDERVADLPLDREIILYCT
jgi:rhodanese-related sulfurtransferase